MALLQADAGLVIIFVLLLKYCKGFEGVCDIPIDVLVLFAEFVSTPPTAGNGTDGIFGDVKSK